MTAQAESTREEIIARNLAAVDEHFHNENPESIEKAIAVYTDDIVWDDVPPELRAGNILKLRTGHADLESATKLLPDVRAAYQRQLNRPDAA